MVGAVGEDLPNGRAARTFCWISGISSSHEQKAEIDAARWSTFGITDERGLRSKVGPPHFLEL